MTELVGCARWAWNKGLDRCLKLLDSGERIPGQTAITYWVKEFRDNPEHAFLKTSYTDNLQQKLRDLSLAWQRYFDPKLEASRPVFKKKHVDSDNSIRFVNFSKYCKIDNRRVKLPGGLGWCRFRKSRNIAGKIKNCTITRNAGHWFISFQVEQKVEQLAHPSTREVGIDMGVAKFVTLSDGTSIKPLNIYRKYEQRLAKEQRRLAKKVKFSNNWRKQKQRITRLHSKIAHCRNDFLHKASTEISKNHAMIVIEDLRTKNMSRSAKGTIDAPGTNVKAKSGLNKSILDQGWYEFRRQLEYKQAWLGGDVLAVPAHHTSQTCPACDHVSPDNRKTQANFTCVQCGHQDNADRVAAINILARGRRVLACGESSLDDSMKQEPVLPREGLAPSAAIAA
ncbi:putative transposase [Litorivivens lipolytica]|uniref:Putative transposase n=2 Tax=Litorivivens lipolytica TaxID=1524264 RepID=A0A7W4W7K4_9GAMM|nr:putative transposase [Litorivivens lipolytica]